MQCPHCLIAFHDNKEPFPYGEDGDSDWTLIRKVCPSCMRYIFSFHQKYERYVVGVENCYYYEKEFLCYPMAYSRAPLSKDVPDSYAKEDSESCLILPDSPKASAALSRRCLQHLLREKANVKPGNLADEIQQVLDEGKLSPRNIGNFAAHPIKSKSTGEIIEVEPGEAEWNLDVLESLFDYFLSSLPC